MPCLVLILFLAIPRVVLALLFFLSNYLERAYHGILIPILGFLFLPLTTLVYAWLVNSHLPIAGFNLVILIVAVIADLGGLGGGQSIIGGRVDAESPLLRMSSIPSWAIRLINTTSNLGALLTSLSRE